jgi:N-acetyl-anhydromuramyl-L-alanine amidase AmpD
MVEYIDLLLPKKCYGGPMVPEGINYHFISAINAHELGLPNDDPFDPKVCYQILEKLKLSAHVLIDRKGNPYRMVPFGNKAWHAGVSILNGRPNCNDWCLSVEFISIGKNSKDLGPAYTEDQIRTGLAIQAERQKLYSIQLPCIGGHDEIRNNAITAGLKNKDGSHLAVKHDPGALFPWGLFRPSKLCGYNAEQKAILAGRSKIAAARLDKKAKAA